MAETILVIEDERMTRTNLLGFLDSEGFNTLEATNGCEGIKMAQRHLPDLIICDILMPEVDGYDVLMTLQENDRTAAIPFIFLTISANESGFQHSLSLGADDYLSKPVTSQRLRTAIAAQLQKRSQLPEQLDVEQLNVEQLNVSTALSASQYSVESAKAQLLDMLCPTLRQKIASLTDKIEQIQLSDIESENASSYESRADSQYVHQHLQQLRGEFVKILSLVNETLALKNSLTADNATVLLENSSLLEGASLTVETTPSHDQ